MSEIHLVFKNEKGTICEFEAAARTDAELMSALADVNANPAYEAILITVDSTAFSNFRKAAEAAQDAAFWLESGFSREAKECVADVIEALAC